MQDINSKTLIRLNFNLLQGWNPREIRLQAYLLKSVREEILDEWESRSLSEYPITAVNIPEYRPATKEVFYEPYVKRAVDVFESKVPTVWKFYVFLDLVTFPLVGRYRDGDLCVNSCPKLFFQCDQPTVLDMTDIISLVK